MDYDAKTHLKTKLERHYANVLTGYHDFLDSIENNDTKDLDLVLELLESQAERVAECSLALQRETLEKDPQFRRYLKRLNCLIKRGYSEEEALHLLRDDDALSDEAWKLLAIVYKESKT